jgi:hypothetical protein
MNHLRRVVAPAYLLAAILIVFTVLDLTQSVWPVRIGDVQWRVLSIGLLSRLLIPPLLALVVAYAAALVGEHKGTLRALAVLDGVLAVVLLVGLAFYSLDALELRARLTQANQNYDIGIALSFVKYLLSFLILAWLTVSQWRAGSAMRRGGRRGAPEPGANVVFSRVEKDKAPGAQKAAPAPPEPEVVQER